MRQNEKSPMVLNHAAAASALAEILLSEKPSEELVRQRVAAIQASVLRQSRYLRELDFKIIHPYDLEILFGAYDEQFWRSSCRRALDGRKLDFRLSSRMTRAGGKTTRFKSRTGEVSYEISIAGSVLFDAFGRNDRSVTVCGLECGNRLEALLRILEHELIHLAEYLCWENSDCAATRFQEIAGRFFLHRTHTHDLVTRHERAAESGIRVGSRVSFVFEGQRLTGRVNRITKRATVLVEDSGGQKYSDGSRCKIYYVPISGLQTLRDHAKVS